ncbi:hypothetical protein FDJ20_gp146 [Vibrio phage Thalassa]|uniref:Uncharacterized protein n=1 Tax=Vibrio phage Thalassa TaxID=2570301 RepID=A0A2H5BH91_9CAUD|nr:hypothetical protein FDJ20_gp146 [Vibrio phage Thalassa]AUG85356.1 hypothetical protein THALASSA_177 [Vibrio phage Thalassa]
MNVIIFNDHVQPTDTATLFGGDSEPVYIIDSDEVRDLPHLLAVLEIYKSTSQARQAGRKGKIPTGWTVMKASKKVELFIWNPTE